MRIDPPCRLRAQVRPPSRSADYPPTRLRRTEPLVRRRRVPPALRWDARPASKTKQRFVARMTAGKPKCLHGRSANRPDDPRQALRRRWRSSFNGLAKPLLCARNPACIVNGAAYRWPAPGTPARSPPSERRPRSPPWPASSAKLGHRYADGNHDRAALTHRDALPRREVGRSPGARTPPKRGSSRVRRGAVPRQRRCMTAGRLALRP